MRPSRTGGTVAFPSRITDSGIITLYGEEPNLLSWDCARSPEFGFIIEFKVEGEESWSVIDDVPPAARAYEADTGNPGDFRISNNNGSQLPMPPTSNEVYLQGGY